MSPWTSFPQGAVLVCASVITVGAPAVVSAAQRERDTEASSPVGLIQLDEDDSPARRVAPTCGPCCHGGGPDCGPVTPEIDVADPVPDPHPNPDLKPNPDPNTPADNEIVESPSPDDAYPIEVAPTCGPCCHGGGPECGPVEQAPPPVEEPASKRGCAVDEPGPGPLPLAVGLGVLALGLRRRRES